MADISGRIRGGTVHMWNGMFLFLGTVTDTEFHRHHAVQLVLGLDGDFSLETASGQRRTSSALIDSGVEHRLRGGSCAQALLLLESGGDRASRFREMLGNGGIAFLQDEEWVRTAADDFLDFFRKNSPIDLVSAYLDVLFSRLFDSRAGTGPADRRIADALSIIGNLDEKRISAREIAGRLFLSETRFLHLFKEETGIPFRRYVLWKRMLDSIDILIGTGDITRAAHDAGFADSAHLARTFKVNFGITLSEIFKNDRFVQVNTGSAM